MAEYENQIGFDAESLAKIRLLPQIFESSKLTQAAKKICAAIARKAKLARIIDTGRLMASIIPGEVKRSPGLIEGNVDTSKDVAQVAKDKKGRYVRLTGTNVYYGKYVEFGTDRMAARPFMRNALDDVTKTDAPRLLKEAVIAAWNNVCNGRNP